MDHGVSVGAIPGITNIGETVMKVADGGANAVIVHKGMVAAEHIRGGPYMGLIIHLSASTIYSSSQDLKTLVCTVEEAVKMGADGISVHINIGCENEKEMLTDLGNVSRAASEWGMPLLAMIYCKGKKIKDEYDPEVIRHAARLGAELGADMVKVGYTGSQDSFQRVVEGCPVPVIIAGGPRMDSDRNFLEMVKEAMKAGASGTSIGRNVFQHRDPTSIVSALSMIVHENAQVEDALKLVVGKTNKVAFV
jgi:predicted phospho-2-dehydro-3-deoxyheptonate aldolase